MRKPILFALLALAATVAMAEAAETRCGWLQNPTPANWWLDDSEGTCTLMTQGAGNEPAGFDRIPDISAGACMKVETDAAEGRITAIHSVRQLPISQCANDTALPAVE